MNNGEKRITPEQADMRGRLMLGAVVCEALIGTAVASWEAAECNPTGTVVAGVVTTAVLTASGFVYNAVNNHNIARSQS